MLQLPPPPTFLHFHSYKLKALFVGLLLFASGSSLCLAQENSTRTKTLSVALGNAKLSPAAVFDGTNTQSTSGLMFDIALSDNPLRLALGYFSGKSDHMTKETIPIFTGGVVVKNETIVTVSETTLGARYYFEDLSPAVDFYAGAGLVSVNYKVTNKSLTETGFSSTSVSTSTSGSGSGTYLGLGARRIFENGFTLGLDYHNANAEEIKVFDGGVKLNYGLTRTSLTLGYNW